MSYYERNGITIHNAEALETLPTISGADLVVTDPPYTFGIASTMQAASKSGTWGDLMNAAYWYAGWMHECKRITENRQGAAWIFTSWRSYPVLAKASTMIRWPINTVLIWDKEWIGPGGHQGLRPSYEMVCLFTHKDFAIADRGLPDIWRHKWSSRKPHGHPAEKPESLIRKIIEVSGAKSVVDPFLGSGTTTKVAQDLGIVATGIEIEKRWCDVAIQRLQQNPLFKPNNGLQSERLSPQGEQAELFTIAQGKAGSEPTPPPAEA